jgi:hypothetical protein
VWQPATPPTPGARSTYEHAVHSCAAPPLPPARAPKPLCRGHIMCRTCVDPTIVTCAIVPPPTQPLLAALSPAPAFTLTALVAHILWHLAS